MDIQPPILTGAVAEASPSPSVTTGQSSGAPVAAGQHAAPNPATAVVQAQAALLKLIGEIAENAAAKPGGLAPLLANLQAAGPAQVPDAVKPVIARILNLALPTAAPPSAETLQTAFLRSGLFTESGFRDMETAAPTAGLDVKSLLLVLRQGLQDWQGADRSATPAPTVPTPATPSALQTYTPQGTTEPTSPFTAPTAGPSPQPAQPAQSAQVPTVRTPASPSPASATTPTPAPASAAAAPASSPPPPSSDAPTQTVAPDTARAPPTPAAAPRAMPPSLLPQEPEPAELSIAPTAQQARPDAPAPLPYAGGPTFAQGPASATLRAGDDVATVVRWLLSGCDAALAHQKILQAASLPAATGGADAPQAGRNAAPTTNWMFEIPFATPQGPAVAQFAIRRDDGDGDGRQKGKQPVWHVRFSIAIEPLGPVHAQVALKGEQAWVSLWADRPASLARLRAGSGQLSDAMAAADFNAEIAFQPEATVKPTAGKLVDRAL